MKEHKKQLLPVLALAAAAVLLLGLWHFTRPQTQEGAKTIQVLVVHGDQSQQEFICHTDAEYLGQVLLDEALAEGETGPYGLYITVVDGEEALESENQWWCITKSGEMLDTAADATPIADGDQFELTLSVY